MKTEQILTDPKVTLNSQVLQSNLGKLYAIYEKLVTTLESERYEATPEWKFYKDGGAWLCKITRKKKTVFWLSAWQSHFEAAFYFTENRSRAGPERFLRDFSGVLVSDAYVCYESLQSAWSERMRWACCHAHARRKFFDLVVANQSPIAQEALARIGRLYAIEQAGRGLDAEARRALRQREAKPVLERLGIDYSCGGSAKLDTAPRASGS